VCSSDLLLYRAAHVNNAWLMAAKKYGAKSRDVKGKQAVWCNFARLRYKAILWETKTRNKHVHKQTHIQIHRQTSERTDGDITNRATKTHKENEQHHQKKVLNLTITQQYNHWPHIISSESCAVHNVQSQSEKVSFHRSSVKMVHAYFNHSSRRSQSSNAKFKTYAQLQNIKYKA